MSSRVPCLEASKAVCRFATDNHDHNHNGVAVAVVFFCFESTEVFSSFFLLVLPGFLYVSIEIEVV